VKVYSFDAGELMRFANQVKDAIADFSGYEAIDKLTVVVAEKSWFGKMANKWQGNRKEDDLVIQIARLDKLP
jgi:hypothetical protein